ncbi:MARVEL domain-containing protein 3 isoform 1-T2 [Pholidichthys leucotaenia]
MPDRGRHHRSDHRSAGDHPRRGQDSRHGDVAETGPAGHRRARDDRRGDATVSAIRGDIHDGHSRQPGDTSVYGQQPRPSLYNFRYILTARGLCQIMEVFVNLLIVICAGVPHSNNGGYRDLASLGGIYYYHFGGANAFTGTEADRVKELDQLFHQLKRPPYVFAMVVGGILMIYACAMLLLGIFRVPYRQPPVLLAEAVVNFLIGLGYIAALAFYFIKLQETYNHPICKDREQMYKSKGHKGFECQFHGTDIAGGLFGVLGVFVFIFGGVLAVRAFRAVRELKKQKMHEDSHF